MKLSIDKEADALYLRLGDSRIIETEEVSPGLMLDFNEAGEVVGDGDSARVQAVSGDGFGEVRF